VHQVHGRRVVAVLEPSPELVDADALVTTEPEVPVSVLGADCVLVAMASEPGVVAAAHAGWRGLVCGVIESTTAAMRAVGAQQIRAVVSASIHAECYPFSPRDLDQVAEVFGDEVRARASSGEPALDLPRVAELALARAGVDVVARVDECTACGGRWFSQRRNGDRARHALVIWRQGG
jgi:polyphenol oxidase